MHKALPSLVYANLSAWGTDGPDCHMPGYDLGAFWSMTGMGASIGREGSYQVSKGDYVKINSVAWLLVAALSV